MDFLSRGPVFKTDSDGERPLYEGGYDARLDYESKVRRWRESAREEAFNTAQLNPEYNAVQKYIQAISGDFWDRKRARYKSKFFDNRLNNSRLNDLALLTDTRPTIDISTSIEAYQNQAKVAAATIKTEWSRNDMDLALISVVDIAKLNGTAFWKMGAALPGKMQVIPCGPESVLPIQPQADIQLSSAVLYRTWKSLNYFRNKFPYNSAGIERESNFLQQSDGGSTRFNRPADIPEYTWNGLSPQIRRMVGVKTESADIQSSPFRSLELQEYWIDDQTINDSPNRVLMRNPYVSLKNHNYWYWVNPGRRLYPRKRLMVFAGRRLMYDGPSPYWHGQYPFPTMRLNPIPWSFWGLSKYRDLLPVNQAMNEIGAGILDMIKRALNPTAITRMGAVTPAAWREFYPDLPGARLQMMTNSNPSADLRYMDPPNIPAWVLQFHQFLSGEYDRLAGHLDVGGLSRKKQAPGGDSIEAMRSSLNTITQLEERFLETFLRDAGRQAVSNVFQHYNIDTLQKLLGEAGIDDAQFHLNDTSLVPDGEMKEDHWRNFAMTVMPGSMLGSAKDREKQIAASLGQHHLIPLRKMYETLELGNPDELLKQLKEEMEAGLGGGGGGRSARLTRGQRNGKAA